jgi:hypothetical protein
MTAIGEIDPLAEAWSNGQIWLIGDIVVKPNPARRATVLAKGRRDGESRDGAYLHRAPCRNAAGNPKDRSQGFVRGQRRDTPSIIVKSMRPPRGSGRKAVSRALLIFDKQT